MEAIEAIMTRRSNRRFTNEMPGKQEIGKIIECGRQAPCGSNSQSVHFIVISDQKVLKDLAEIARDEFSKMEVNEDTYVSLKNSILASKRGDYVFHYGAPLLIVTANKKGYGNAMADSACALENMMIAANALDLASCYINQLHWLSDNERIVSYMETIGLEKDEYITGALALGKAETLLQKEKQITGNPVTWVG